MQVVIPRALSIAVMAFCVAGAACTSDSFTPPGDGGDTDASADGGADQQASDAATEPDAVSLDAAVETSAEACTPTAYYLDADGDGYGGTSTELACAPPGPQWVTTGGDCDDGNADVHPGQVTFFTTGYVPTGKTTVSFDYDCDGKETESGSSPKADCKVVNLACVGSGYLPVTPSRGSGADDYCGSDQVVTCAGGTLSCQQGAPETTNSPIACR